MEALAKIGTQPAHADRDAYIWPVSGVVNWWATAAYSRRTCVVSPAAPAYMAGCMHAQRSCMSDKQGLPEQSGAASLVRGFKLGSW